LKPIKYRSIEHYWVDKQSKFLISILINTIAYRYNAIQGVTNLSCYINVRYKALILYADKQALKQIDFRPTRLPWLQGTTLLS
jgi:hypothetical protein